MTHSYPFADFRTANSCYFSLFSMASFSFSFHKTALFSFLHPIPFWHFLFPYYSFFHRLKNSLLKVQELLPRSTRSSSWIIFPLLPSGLGILLHSTVDNLQLLEGGLSKQRNVSREQQRHLDVGLSRGQYIFCLPSRFQNLFLFHWRIKLFKQFYETEQCWNICFLAEGLFFITFSLN